MKIGDIVTLKSQGPTMTVVRAAVGGAECRCMWFDASGRRHEGDFPVASLSATKSLEPKLGKLLRAPAGKFGTRLRALK